MQFQALSCRAGRFNERLVLSLASNPACILMDDELNILPTSSHVANIKPLPRDDNGAGREALHFRSTALCWHGRVGGYAHDGGHQHMSKIESPFWVQADPRAPLKSVIHLQVLCAQPVLWA